MLQLGKDDDNNDLPNSFLINCGGFDVPPISTYIFVWPLESQLHPSVVCQPQPTRPHRSISRGRTKPFAAKSTVHTHGVLGISNENTTVWSSAVDKHCISICIENSTGTLSWWKFYSPRARLEVPRIWSRMIQKVCAVFDLCELGLVFDGIQWAASSFWEVCIILVIHWPVKRDIELQEMPMPLRNSKSISVS